MAEEDPPAKALTKNPLGPSGRAVAANVDRLRKAQNLTFAALSERLDAVGRPIPPLGLRKIVAETRRVDADDLVGLAVALGVSPVTLLMSRALARSELVTATGMLEVEIPAELLWRWLTAGGPLPGSDMSPIAFADRACPVWEHQEFEKLWEDVQLARRSPVDGDD